MAMHPKKTMNPPKHIMAAVDFSPQSQTIVDHACDLAEEAHAELHVVHVVTRSAAGDDDATRLGLERLGFLVRPAHELVLKTKKCVVKGIPHRALVDYANSNGIDLIVMGTHGRKGLSYLALGSVAERVLRDAPCPVQVLKSPPRTPTQLDQAAAALNQAFGDKLTGTAAETEEIIQQTIIRELNVSDAVAKEIWGQLKRRDRATWESLGDDSGKWTFTSQIDFVEVKSDFQPTTNNSPATVLISRARKLRATDIHVDPINSSESRVRLRVDGQLSEYCRMDREVTDHLINQWKMMSGLDIAEPFRPKEGRIDFPPSATEFSDVEARVTTTPVANGEAVAIRLFSRENVFIPLGELGFGSPAQASVDKMLRRMEGLILVTGPTGSGKSTTVYSMLETISTSGINIVSIEDPVEFSVPFVRQMEVDERHGISMTDGLRTLLRMDPDVVFLGEIRDEIAVEIAMRAASSGRYVFTTLHTRDVASVMTALRDLGLSNRSLAANISGIVNQRLMRRLCTNCRESIALTAETQALFDRHRIDFPDHVYQPGGCPQCRGTGYHGRIGVFEAISVDHEIRSAFAEGKSEWELRDLLADRGMVRLDVDAFAKVAAGITDLDEAMRVRWLV